MLFEFGDLELADIIVSIRYGSFAWENVWTEWRRGESAMRLIAQSRRGVWGSGKAYVSSLRGLASNSLWKGLVHV